MDKWLNKSVTIDKRFNQQKVFSKIKHFCNFESFSTTKVIFTILTHNFLQVQIIQILLFIIDPNKMLVYIGSLDKSLHRNQIVDKKKNVQSSFYFSQYIITALSNSSCPSRMQGQPAQLLGLLVFSS